MMNNKQTKRLHYLPPLCEVIEAESEGLICSVSVRPNGSNSSSSDSWKEKDHEGGSGFFGNEDNVAPAKKAVCEEDC